MSSPTTDKSDEFYQLVGQVVELSAQLEFLLVTTLASVVAKGDARVGLMVVAGESFSWVTTKLARIGKRYPNQLPGLDQAAAQCAAALEKRNRVVHDWHTDDGEGDRTALRLTRKDTKAVPLGLEQRGKTISEVREALEAVANANRDFIALTVTLGDRLWNLDPDA
jgi:hypothetical protein